MALLTGSRLCKLSDPSGSAGNPQGEYDAKRKRWYSTSLVHHIPAKPAEHERRGGGTLRPPCVIGQPGLSTPHLRKRGNLRPVSVLASGGASGGPATASVG